MKINESKLIHNLQEDVDYLYTKYFENDVNRLKNNDKYIDDMFKPYVDHTYNLKSDLASIGNELNPCEIFINSDNRISCFYNPKRSEIGIGVSVIAHDILKDSGSIRNGIIDTQSNIFEQEFTEHRIKGSIHHELLHWLDDTLHGRNIRELLNKINIRGLERYTKKRNINHTYIEIHAQLANINQLKKKLGEEWDLISFDSAIALSPALTTVNNKLSIEDRKDWIKTLKYKMYKYGLLGASMKDG